MNDRKRAVRYGISFVILAVLLIFLFIWNVNSGSIHLSVQEILNIIFRHQGDEISYNIVWEIRLPRILSVIILGGALSVSGFLLQTFFNNPIAGPFVLGISSGAKLIVAFLMIFLLSRSVSIGSGAMILAAFAGSMISMGFVLLVAKKVHNMSMLVISGGKFFRHDLGQCTDYGCGGISYYGDCIFYVKTHQRLSAGRDLRTEYGSQYQSVPDPSDPAFQYSFRLCDRICRPDLLCGNRR